MEHDQDQAMFVMSVAMNSCFDASSFNEYTRKFGYSADAVKEFITNIAEDKTYCKVVGSTAERTDLLFSDLDILMIDKCSTVGYHPREATYSNEVYLRLTSGPSTRAGYTKLQIYRNGKPNKIDCNIKMPQFDYHCVHINKRKSFLTNISIFPWLVKSNDNPLYYYIHLEKHGPTATSTFSKQPLDKVPAYESQIIPKEMMPWFEGKRRFNSLWPSKETCDLFKSMGCCYVGVGHLKSQEQPLEWRISPTRQELYLMLNLNPTQYRCYITLKVIKKEFVEKVCDDMLSSYHCKTALFYAIENTDPTFWQSHNLMQCVLNCLKLLLDWVNKRNCPNYFIPEENMFETKLIDDCKIQKLQVILGKLINTTGSLGTLMYHISYLTRLKSEIKSIWGKARDLKKALINVSDITQCSLSEHGKKILEIYNQAKCLTEQNYLEEIKMLCPYEPEYSLLEEALEERLFHLKRFEHLLSVMRKKLKVNKYLDLHKDITEALPEDFQYCLKLASIAMAQKDYVMCDKLLQKVKNIAYSANVICYCDIFFIEETTTRKRDKTTEVCVLKLASAGKNLTSMSITQIMQQFTMCLNFIESEVEEGLVMTPLHVEAYKKVGKSHLSELQENVEDLMSLHPVTYMYFLQYKNSEMMEKKCDMCFALEKLENMNLVSLNEGIYGHPDIILNLLGHIYITKGWYRPALQCFRRSWQLIPDINTAKWHIMFLLFGCPKQVSKRRFKKKKVNHR